MRSKLYHNSKEISSFIDNLTIISYNNSMGKKEIKILKLILVNLITGIRLIGAIMLPFVYAKNGANFAALFIIILFLTDAIDGFLARHLHVSTFFGGLMDATSDKLLNGIAFIILGIEYNIMIAPLIIEISIAGSQYSTFKYGGNIQSSFIGKIKTIILDVSVILCFLLLALPTLNIKAMFIQKLIHATDFIIHILGFVILLACLIALIDYLGKNKEARLNPKSDEIKKTKKKRKSFKQILDNLFDTEYYKEHKDESIMKQFYIN